MSTRLHIVMSDGLVGRVDRARGDVPRSVWVRRAVEFGLSHHTSVGLDVLLVEAARLLHSHGLSVEEGLAAEKRGAVERALASEERRSGSVSSSSLLAAEQFVSRRHAPNCKCPVCK